MKKSFPCQCGHPKYEHEFRYGRVSPILQFICWECMRNKYDLEDKFIKEYHPFNPDNLKYLEQISNKKVDK